MLRVWQLATLLLKFILHLTVSLIYSLCRNLSRLITILYTKAVISVNEFPARCSTIYCYSYPISCTETINHTVVTNPNDMEHTNITNNNATTDTITTDTTTNTTTNTTVVPTTPAGAAIKATNNNIIILLIATILLL